MSIRRNIVLVILTVCAYICVYAQTDTIRYVSPSGSYNNDGLSWATSKNRLQDAINDLRDYMLVNNLTHGAVYVAAGTYVPTESTESSGGTMLNTSFKIYSGIHVYGGFNPASPESSPGDRMMINGKRVRENWSDPSGIGTTSGTEIASQWDLQYKTILSGNHSSSEVTFEFDSIRGRFNTAFPVSSYHVVWFATNGKYETGDEATQGHYRPLDYPALVDGCVIYGGNASTRATSGHEHTAYGGGVYMVGNAELRNCTVERCNSTLRGGGVYLDGGGLVEFCYIHTCQSAGVGVVQGYGGGVNIDYDGQVGHSHITNCAARCGGGLSICHITGEYPFTSTSNYSPFSTACVISNNTASAEGGGIYMAEGGTINHATVTANNCIGPDVTYYGRRHGRSGGIYIRDCGMIFNSVFWGNRCQTNNDVQFASVRQVSNPSYEVFAYHTAFMNHDITDWTDVRKDMVFSLDKSNMPAQGGTGNYPCFFNPTVKPSNWDDLTLPGPGAFKHLAPEDFPGPRIWHLTTYSALDQKGVQVNESVVDAPEWLVHAHTDYGVVTNPYEPTSTLGALVRRPDPIVYALIPAQGQEGRDGGGVIPTLFIDPNRKGVYDAYGHFVPQDREGNSWDTPVRDLGEAIQYFRKYLRDDPGDNHHYMVPLLDGSGYPTSDSVRYDYVQFVVKEGTITTAGPGNYIERNIRTAAMRVESHMRLYGGYPSSLTGTTTAGRNPRTYKTTITSNLTGKTTEQAYENNSAHAVAMVNAEHSIIDGFTLRDANTHNVYLSTSVHAGGGLLLNNATTPVGKRVNMVGNQLRNCVITNCTSPKGAAIYVNGEHLKSDGEICYAELMMINCVVRNNKADYTVNPLGIVTEDHGVITANGRAYVHIEHCTIVNNIGFPFKADDRATDSDAPIYCSHDWHNHESTYHGYIRVDNSIVFCNGDRSLDDRGDLGGVGRVTSVNADGQDYVFGRYNMFDADLVLHQADCSQPHGFFQNGYTVPITDHFLPDGVVSHYTTDITAVPADSTSRHNLCLLTRANSAELTYPTFLNPARNVGNAPGGDRPLYGGVVSYTPMTTNPCVNAAYEDDYTVYNNFDRSDVITRTHGGAPDIGAVENTDLPAAGEIIYVTPDGAGKRDGSSWDNAIAGNTVYRLYNAPAAAGDSVDIASGARLINRSTGNPVTTNDNRYCGGYATKYVYPIFYDYGKAYTRSLEINVYEGGANAGRIDTLSNDTTATSSIPGVRCNNKKIPDNIVSTKAVNADYPYGEMSGVSRYIYRAEGNYSPLTEDGNSVMFAGISVPSNAAGAVASGRLILTNERRENYVSGLQYAVEKASQTNKLHHKDSVQVWVAAGKYTDYKGYVMRDSVSVYGGFPAGKYAAPGMSERRALMSNVVAIPKSKENEDLDAEDYETILQISDVNPKSGSGASAVINPAAVKFYDNGQSVKLYINNNISRFTDNNTIHHYRWDGGAGTYVLDHTDNTVTNSSSVRTTWSDELYDPVGKKRNCLRKRVLQMPDVTNPVYCHGLGDPTANSRGKYGDALAHYERVIKEGRLSNVKSGGGTVNGRHQDPNYKEYNAVYWDGFTIRHGFLTNMHHAHAGGAGVSMFEGARLVNCIVTDNFTGCRGVKGGGVFCDGSTSTIENCFILNNTLTKGQHGDDTQLQGAGLFLYEGTCFNSLMGNNWSRGPGGGVALCVGKFYNNTLAYNTSNVGVGGLRICTGSEPALFMANTIIFGNNGLAIDITDGKAAVAPFINCYIQSATEITKANFLNAINDHVSGVTDGFFGRKNTFLNRTNPSADNTPFAADVAGGVYDVANPGAKLNNDFALRQVSGVTCINSGEEDFEGAMYEAVRAYLQRTNASFEPSDAAIKNETFYKNVVGVQLPQNDVVYAKRIQDCQVDVGAYEFNAAYAIRPDTVSHPGTAIFYIAFTSPGGDASASAPENAACAQKMQQVIDAAGRYKNSLMTEAYYDRGYTIVGGVRQPDKTWKVEVRIQGDDTNSTTDDEYTLCYSPTRSTKHSVANYNDNILDYSWIIPHGVVIKGGYSSNFHHYEKNGAVVYPTTPGAHVVDERDPLTYRTVLSGRITSSTGAEGQCYHVVTFTNDLFDYEEMVIDEGGQLASYSAREDAEAQRAVLDGLFLEHGFANAPDGEDRCGGGAVVPGYAHIRNCVVQHNEANDYGGGLYLQPNALVSGTIIKSNSASVGGGIYIEAPENQNPDTLAHIYSTTICANTATASAGGMWFDNTNARVNSTVVWQNNANDNANVSGNFSRTSADTEYPFNYCAVESRRLEGQCNLELSPTETEGVRWDNFDPFSAIQYYPIEMSSTLARAGMTYSEWYNRRERFTTLDSIDIAGVSRLRWQGNGSERGYAWGSDTLVTKDNDFIEIGARALNRTFQIIVDPRYIMRRLFVMRTELLNSDAARALQNNSNDDDVSNMYRQMGSSILNPFHRLGDAFDYIIAARKAVPDRLRNARFEVYVEQGTYYPYHNAYGEQDQVRNNTFLIPEATTVIGGINSRAEGHNYCQAGYVDAYTSTIIGDGSDIVVPGTGYTLDYSLADSIRLRDDRHRPMRDINLNSVIEPWELEHQTILSGNAVSGEAFTHVYHVVTIHADSTKVGPQPFKYRDENPDADWKEGGEHILTNPISMDDPEHFTSECERSLTARSIILDGISISGGYANHLDSIDAVRHPYQKKTYFRGGGILVDGNWTQSFDVDNDEVPYVTTPTDYNIPLVLRHCQISDNMAANGGAIFSNGDLHIYSSHFTQNYSQGPMTKIDQKYIPWSAGGCIATNSYCGVVNTLFDNNEARRGLYPIKISGEENIPNADARQGFGGVLSVSQDALLRAVNCHFMRNKAVAYSAVYNIYPNNLYTNRDSIQTVFNSIFWGNEVFEVDNIGQLEHIESPTLATIETFNNNYKASRAGVFHYDATEWAKYERLYHEYDSLYHHYVLENDTFNVKVTDKLDELRAQGNLVEGLYYCSYRKTYGPSGMRSNRDGYLLTESEYRDFVDARALPIPIKVDPLTGDIVGDYTQGFTSLRGNNNVLINRVNNASDGPNFKQPSMVAGIDGYMQNADWLSTRLNVTTDQGWGHLRQRVERGYHYTTPYTGDETFETAEEALAAAKAIDPSATAEDVLPIGGTPVATFDGVVQPAVPALYNYLAYRASRLFYDYATPPLPCGEDVYMTHTNMPEIGSFSASINRISKNPRMHIEDVYIDMGIYEYQYIQLNLKGNEIDTVWVATAEKDPSKHDGLSWETPTTDLQSAIELVMSSCNNHDKYVCLMGDALSTYAPNLVLDNRLAYVITSNTLTPLLPDTASADTDYSIKSLTFLGGYNFDVKSPRDPQANPTVIEMPNIGSHTQLNQLFVIEDMTREKMQVNWQGELRTRDNMVIPITFDGLTFINPYSSRDALLEDADNVGGMMTNKGGAAIYYRWQHFYEESDGVYTPDFNYALYPDSAMIDRRNRELPKLTISNCTFLENGKRTANLAERSAAVRIDPGGGKSLIVNSLFHSNAGSPVYSKTHDEVVGENNLAQVPNDVIIVNSTFALNEGHVNLATPNSEVHNSIIWLDDLANDTTVQLKIDGMQWDKTTNKARIGVAGRMTHNAVWGCFTDGDDTYKNVHLVTENKNIFEGPYFVDPKIDAPTAEQRRQRDFHLNPGVMMLNGADTTLYRNRVFFRTYPDETLAAENYLWLRPVGFKKDTIASITQDHDHGYTPRLTGVGMERGAYECQAALQRVVYVRPNMSVSINSDGSSWDRAFGRGQLQNAIDVASVYTFFNSLAENPDSRRAYVYVKGSYETDDQIDLIARDGVNVFGSIPGTFNDTAWLFDDEYTNDECRRYLNYTRAIHNGVASPSTTPTRINSITAEGDYTTGFLLDGFVITNPGKVLDASPIVLNAHATLRNCIITDNHVEGAPIADVQRGLIYNSLFYGDTASTFVKAGAAGLLLNNTIVASRAGDAPIDESEAVAENIVNNITYNESAGPAPYFAPYFTSRTPYTLPAYFKQYPALGYQLHEHSKLINAGTEELPTAYNVYVSDRLVDFDHDRDLLGNPRRVGGQIDKGAFETWRVENGQVFEITSLTNVLKDEAVMNFATPVQLRNAFLNNYGGNKYPHRGSVVYVMNNSALTMAYDDPADFAEVIFRPGFMLMKEGASFYGNGHPVQMNYLAVEKRLSDQQFAMNAFPFDYYTDNITVSSYNSATDALSSQLSGIGFRTYQYNGVARSAKDYSFQPSNSTLWQRVDTAHRVATEGYLVDYLSTQDTLLRYNAFAANYGDYVYTETGDDKIVQLRQHDSRIPGTGAALNFTRQEDMGWNMKGLPWLVSGYRTDTTVYEGNYLRQMYIPHVFYYMNGDGTYRHLTAPDRIYAARSWDPGTTLTMGDAFLTQTATMNDHENVIFHQPYYTFNEPASRPIVRVARRGDDSHGDYVTVMPDSAASQHIEYRYGRDGVKWTGSDTLTSAYIIDNDRSSRVSLLGAAPIDTDIPFGVYAPAADNYTFSLPELDAFAGYRYVWLIDYDRHSYTNLLNESYSVDLGEGNHDKRFAIRIGGFPLNDDNGRKYTIFVQGGTLHVHGLFRGDHVAVYAPTGQLIIQGYSAGASFTTPLPIVSGYVVKVNDYTQKVIR